MEADTGKNGTVSLGEILLFLLRDDMSLTEDQTQLIFDITLSQWGGRCGGLFIPYENGNC